MPKRTDIHSILLIGSGPIIIGQACEFDYSGTQAVKALKEEGYRVILVNSNPATIMTDPNLADRTYIEPITPEVVAQIIEKERPDALLPTMGAQTALNIAMRLHEMGVLEKFGVELIGAKIPAIQKAESREQFKAAMNKIGLRLPDSGLANTLEQAREVVSRTGFPAIIRPSFTLGGTGGAIVYNKEEFDAAAAWGIECSPVDEILVEQSVLGWKEYELEVMRDHADNVVIICSIENLDPMGIHTGDSITVAPAQTLTDREYQKMRDASLAIIREIGVDTGGSNIQFAVNPANGDMVVIEMNPRVSRSSALASKATGFPIAKIAAKLAVGYTLDELPNDITKKTKACFEPTIDYVVTKVPRFTFEKFPGVSRLLSTQMKSVGEVMAIGRTFAESLQKALRSLEIDRSGFDDKDEAESTAEMLAQRIREPYANRIWYIAEGFRRGMTLEQIHDLSRIDPWFLHHIRRIVEAEKEWIGQAKRLSEGGGDAAAVRNAKAMGFSDRRLARLTGLTEKAVRDYRHAGGIRPVFKRVDTCGAEFVAHTPYLYSTYEEECEAAPTDRKKVMILGGGPNRIGQGIEFDYCCVHASYALREAGYEVIMVNCNPETVSTDYDTSDRLYFEPITLEDVLEIFHREKPMGVVLQFGGQTPLKLAVGLAREGVPILGTSWDSIDRAEDRERFNAMMTQLGLRQPDSGIARSAEEAASIARRIGYPVLIRPSYVLGGRAMEIVHDEASLQRYMREAIHFSPDHPILIDQYLHNAIELDVDALGDGQDYRVGGIMEHIEEAGVHSGDSACCLPPHSIPREMVEEIRTQTLALAKELQIVGLMNVQFAVADGKIYVLEVNPRASRTAPFVSKATGNPLAKIAALTLVGKTLAQQGYQEKLFPPYMSVKESVFPFLKFPGLDPLLGPEMKSTGEVMGIAPDFAEAFGKAQLGAGQALPISGTVFISVKDEDKAGILPVARRLATAGFKMVATRGTAAALGQAGIAVEAVNKVNEGRPNIVDMIKNHEIALVLNTSAGAQAIADSASIRRGTLSAGIPYATTLAGADGMSKAIASLVRQKPDVRPLQDYHG